MCVCLWGRIVLLPQLWRTWTRWIDELVKAARSWWMQAASSRGNWSSMAKAYVQQWASYGWYDHDESYPAMLMLPDLMLAYRRNASYSDHSIFFTSNQVTTGRAFGARSSRAARGRQTFDRRLAHKAVPWRRTANQVLAERSAQEPWRETRPRALCAGRWQVNKFLFYFSLFYPFAVRFWIKPLWMS